MPHSSLALSHVCSTVARHLGSSAHVAAAGCPSMRCPSSPGSPRVRSAPAATVAHCPGVLFGLRRCFSAPKRGCYVGKKTTLCRYVRKNKSEPCTLVSEGWSHPPANAMKNRERPSYPFSSSKPSTCLKENSSFNSRLKLQNPEM